MTIKHNNPAGASGGAGRKGAPVGAARHPHSTPSRPACQAPVATVFRRWLEQARVCATRDLAAAEDAKRAGDMEAYYRLRRRGLRHQVLQVALETVLGG